MCYMVKDKKFSWDDNGLKAAMSCASEQAMASGTDVVVWVGIPGESLRVRAFANSWGGIQVSY